MTEQILRFRNERCARYFADNHGYEYLGFVKEYTTFSISRGSGDISHVDGGSYQVRKEVRDEAV
jgi:hypothetical protein